MPSLHLHATAGWDLAAVPVPGDLRLGKTADPRRWDDGAVALGDGLGAFTFLETAHDCRREEEEKKHQDVQTVWTGGAAQCGRNGRHFPT